MKHTRQFADRLLLSPEVTPAMLAQAHSVINTLCDVIGTGRPAPATGKPRVLTPAQAARIRELITWHRRHAEQARKEASGVRPRSRGRQP